MAGSQGRSNETVEKSCQELEAYLLGLADTIVADVSGEQPERAHELLSAFVSQLFLSAAKQSARQERMKKQAEGIAAAKARGVRFGAQSRPLPENFEEVCRCWHSKQLTLKQAAELCGLPQSTFYDAAKRAARSAG